MSENPGATRVVVTVRRVTRSAGIGMGAGQTVLVIGGSTRAPMEQPVRSPESIRYRRFIIERFLSVRR